MSKTDNRMLFSQIEAEDLIEKIAHRTANLMRQDSNLMVHTKPTDIMSRKDTAKFLSVSVATLHRWTKQGKLKQYGIGNRIYYKREEVIEALQMI